MQPGRDCGSFIPSVRSYSFVKTLQQEVQCLLFIYLLFGSGHTIEIHNSLALASSIGVTGMHEQGYLTHFRVSLQEGVRDPPTTSHHQLDGHFQKLFGDF